MSLSVMDNSITFSLHCEEFKTLKKISKKENKSVKKIILESIERESGHDFEVIYYQEKIGKLLDKIFQLQSQLGGK